MKLKRGDTVKIIKGKDKGKTGTVDTLFPGRDQALVAGVNQYKRHVKGRAQNEKSEIRVISKPLNVSAVALVCPKCGKPTRIGYTIDNNNKVRMCRKCGQVV